MDHASRLDRLLADLARPLLVSTPENLRYLTGFVGSNGFLAVTPGRATFITDGRYGEVAAELVARLPSTELVVYTTGVHDRIAAAFVGATEIGLEAGHVTWSLVKQLGERTSATIEADSGVVERYRMSKDPAEVDALRKAAATGDEAFGRITELADPAATEGHLGELMLRSMQQAGGERPGWEPIVAAGANASRPHHRTGSGEIGTGLLLLDYGCIVDGYHSDMTRTLLRDEAGDKELDRVYAAVLEANRAGIAAVAPGVRARDVDNTCRDVLTDHGYGDLFVHSTGHGVGLEIHEAPSLRRESDDLLEPGNVVTIEPGVYIPNRLGVRIEDMVLVTDDGGEVLTKSPKELILE